MDEQYNKFIKKNWFKIAISIVIVFVGISTLYNLVRKKYDVVTYTDMKISQNEYDKLKPDQKVYFEKRGDQYIFFTKGFSLFYFFVNTIISFLFYLVIFSIVMKIVSLF